MVTKWKIFELKEVRVQCDWQMDGVICNVNVIVQSYEDEFDSEEEATLFLMERFESDESITYDFDFIIKKVVKKL